MDLDEDSDEEFLINKEENEDLKPDDTPDVPETERKLFSEVEMKEKN